MNVIQIDRKRSELDAASCLGCGDSSLKAFPPEDTPAAYICAHCAESLTDAEARRLVGDEIQRQVRRSGD